MWVAGMLEVRGADRQGDDVILNAVQWHKKQFSIQSYASG